MSGHFPNTTARVQTKGSAPSALALADDDESFPLCIAGEVVDTGYGLGVEFEGLVACGVPDSAGVG